MKKTVVITGATDGIGKALATLLSIENEDGCVHDIVIRPFIEDNMA